MSWKKFIWKKKARDFTSKNSERLLAFNSFLQKTPS